MPHLKSNVPEGSFLDEASALTVKDAIIKVDKILAKSKYFHGEVLTETDIRLFTTLIRYADVTAVASSRCTLATSSATASA